MFGGLLTLLYGAILGPAFAQRDALVKMMGTLALLLILLGIMSWRAPVDAATVRILTLETTDWTFQLFGVQVNGTQVLAIVVAIVITAGISAFLTFTGLGTAMRALANDREITATLGVPVRKVEAAAWFGSGIICGGAGLLLADLLQTLDYTTLTFLVSFALAAALIGGLRSLWGTLIGGLVIGDRAGRAQPVLHDRAVPARGAVRDRDHRAPLARSAPCRRHLEVGPMIAAPGPGNARSAAPSIAVFLFVALFLGPLAGGDWMSTFGSMAIYSVVAAGLGVLYGRVGMISLCQIGLLALGTWIGARIAFATSLPFPIVLLLAGVLTAAIGVFIGLFALRLSGLHLALITLMAAGAITEILNQIEVPERWRRIQGQCSRSGGLEEHADRSPALDRHGRHRVLPLCRDRVRAHVRVRARCTSRPSPAERGRQSARASPPLSPPASTSRSTSSGPSVSRRS